MKAFLVGCAIISIAVLTYGFPRETDTFVFDESEFESDEFDLDNLEHMGILKDGGFPIISEEEIACIRDGIIRVSLSHPGLKSWFEELLTTGEKLLRRAYDCSKKAGLRRRLCFTRLEVVAVMEYGYLRKKLGQEGSAIFHDLKGVVMKCFVDH